MNFWEKIILSESKHSVLPSIMKSGISKMRYMCKDLSFLKWKSVQKCIHRSLLTRNGPISSQRVNKKNRYFLARCTLVAGPPEHGFYVKGFINYKDDMIKHGERISYGCNATYALVGDSTQECNDGRWTNPRPSCKGLTVFFAWKLLNS